MLNTETRHKRDAEYTDLDIERRLDHLRSLIFGQHAYYRKRVCVIFIEFTFYVSLYING